jgi:hypothetical protein
MDFSQIDWAVVGATFLGPIFAVIITLWVQDRSSVRQTRMSVYEVMMRLRRFPTNNDFVGAFNLVPVHFHGVAKVMAAYRAVQRILNDHGWRIPDAVPQLNRDHEIALATLLVEMSRTLGIKVESADIQNGGYAPDGWRTEQETNEAMRQALFGVLIGARAVKVDMGGVNPEQPLALIEKQEQGTQTGPQEVHTPKKGKP